MQISSCEQIILNLTDLGLLRTSEGCREGAYIGFASPSFAFYQLRKSDSLAPDQHGALMRASDPDDHELNEKSIFSLFASNADYFQSWFGFSLRPGSDNGRPLRLGVTSATVCLRTLYKEQDSSGQDALGADGIVLVPVQGDHLQPESGHPSGQFGVLRLQIKAGLEPVDDSIADKIIRKFYAIESNDAAVPRKGQQRAAKDMQAAGNPASASGPSGLGSGSGSKWRGEKLALVRQHLHTMGFPLVGGVKEGNAGTRTPAHDSGQVLVLVSRQPVEQKAARELARWNIRILPWWEVLKAAHSLSLKLAELRQLPKKPEWWDDEGCGVTRVPWTIYHDN